MKEQFLKYLRAQLAQNEKMLACDSLSEDDKNNIQSVIDNLNSTIESVDAMEGENNEAVEALKTTIGELENGLKAVQEKINQQNQNITEEHTMEQNEYLKSQNSVHDFAEAIRNARTADEFRSNWNEKLSTNGITITEGSEPAFVPEAVKGMITDIWDRNADWLKDLHNTNAKRFYCRYNTSDQTAETSRAKGWKKGDTKVGQTIAVASKLIEGQFIYKIQEIDLKTKFDSDAALIQYVIGELVDQVLYEIKRAILVGDGRLANDDYKISSFESIAKSVTDDWTTVSTASSTFLVDDIRAMVDGIKNENGKPVYLFMSKDTLRGLARVQASSTSTPVFLSVEQVCEQCNASRIITTDLLGSDFTAVAFIPSEYYLVGENVLNPSLYTWHEGYKNLDVYRYECVAGGAINAKKSSAVLLPAGE